MSEAHDNLREAVARIAIQVMHLYHLRGDLGAASAHIAHTVSALPALSVPEGWRKALEFYRDAWSLVTEGDEPDPVYGGGGITSQYLEPSTALLDDQGKRARDALSAPGGEGSSRPWPIDGAGNLDGDAPASGVAE